MTILYGHSVADRPEHTWESLATHSAAVARRAAESAAPFGWADVARAAGHLHDIGKCSALFQAYLHAAGEQARGPDHSSAGAVEARRLYPGPLGRMLAFAIAGHHAGLADGVDLEERLRKALPAYDGWEQHVGPVPEKETLAPGRFRRPSPHRGFSLAFLTRMLFSCLVDADFIETEAFYAHTEDRDVERDGFKPLPDLRTRLRGFMADIRAAAAATPLNELRALILDHAVAKAELPPGLFTLTVPTGGGKTLASLSFALEHAVRHGLRRVIYVIPFTSIIEQTAAVFRGALGESKGQDNTADILEHHATFDWETAARRTKGSEGGRRPRERSVGPAPPRQRELGGTDRGDYGRAIV